MILTAGTDHAEFLHDVPDEYLADAMPLAPKVAVASGLKFYNILQVNRVEERLWDYRVIVLMAIFTIVIEQRNTGSSGRFGMV